MQTSVPPSPTSQKVSLLRQLLGCLGSADFRNFEICLLLHLKLLAKTDHKTSFKLKVKPHNQVTTNEYKFHEY